MATGAHGSPPPTLVADSETGGGGEQIQSRKSNNLSPIVEALTACNLGFLLTLLKPFPYYEAYQLEGRHILLLL